MTISASPPAMAADELSDEALAASLPGDFRSAHAEVKGTRLHYVSGGAGRPLVLLPGWPQPWWVAFNSAPGVSEKVLAGRPRPVLDILFDYGLANPAAITGSDRAVYERAYLPAEANRAVTGWFQAFGQDIADLKTYATVTTP